MDYIDYQEAKFSFIGTRKHFFKDQQYFITVFDDTIILGITADTQTPKYKISLDINLKINWDLKKQKNKAILISFVFPFKNKIKAVHANHDDLIKLKQFLGIKVTYEGIGDLYTPILQIGKGSSAKVYSAENILDQKVYAIKAIEKTFLNSTEKGQGLAAYKMEIQILKILSNYSSHFLTLREIYEGDQTYYLVTDYLEGQSLSEEIDKAKTLPERKLPIQCIKMMMAKLLSSLALLHQHKIIHRDLKPDNLMFSKKNDYSSLVMVDFGLATSEHLDKFLFPKCGTPGYVAPEILTLLPNNKYTTKVDMFSCGCILFKLLTGRSIFSGKTFDEVLKANKKCSIDLDIPIDKQYITEDSLNLLSQLLNKNPKFRISAKQALQHPFFDQVNEYSTQLYASIFSSVKVQNNGNFNLQYEEQLSQYDLIDDHINSELKEDETKTIQQIPQSKRCSLMSEFQTLNKSQLSQFQFYQKEPLSCIRCFKDLSSPKEQWDGNFD